MRGYSVSFCLAATDFRVVIASSFDFNLGYVVVESWEAYRFDRCEKLKFLSRINRFCYDAFTFERSELELGLTAFVSRTGLLANLIEKRRWIHVGGLSQHVEDHKS